MGGITFMVFSTLIVMVLLAIAFLFASVLAIETLEDK